MSDTPRTDAVMARCGYSWGGDVGTLESHAKELERENAELRATVIEECAGVCFDETVKGSGAWEAACYACAHAIRALAKPRSQP